MNTVIIGTYLIFIVVLWVTSTCHSFTTVLHNFQNGKRTQIIQSPYPIYVQMDESSSSSSSISSDSDIKIDNNLTDSETEKAPVTPVVSPPTIRRVDNIERFSRLPVWPVWNGVLIFVLSRIFGNTVAAKIEDIFGGRVCPNFYNANQVSPFIMLVHHTHSFAIGDPLRYIQRAIIAEGFPSHSHRGFITVTTFLKGGFSHRDSLGIKQTYGAEECHNGKHTQYLMTGAGLLHEEMFDIHGTISKQELFQLWLNIPAANKLDPPFVQLLGGEEETPTVVTTTKRTRSSNDGNDINQGGGKVQTLILAGKYKGQQSSARLFSDVSIFHVQMQSNACWKYNLPKSHATALMYIRAGTVIIDDEVIGPHNTVYFGSIGEQLMVETSGRSIADFIFLSGEPLREPVAAQGSMVMCSASELNQAYIDYQAGKMGVPWDHKISDDEWKEHIKKYPSIYRKK